LVGEHEGTIQECAEFQKARSMGADHFGIGSHSLVCMPVDEPYDEAGNLY